MRAFALCVLGWFCVSAGASASAADDAWRFKVVAKLGQIQSRASCFATPKQSRYVHILGVQNATLNLLPARQSHLINTLSEAILSNTPNRVTVARQFQDIATRSVSISPERIREIQALASEAEKADITILLQPVRKVANRLDLQVTMWVTDQEKTGDNKISCVTPFSTSVAFEDDADPQCARAWRQAQLRDDVTGYQGFIDFFPDCAQALEARQRIDSKRKAERVEKKTQRCRAAFVVARTAGSLKAYRDFVTRNFDCPEIVGARAAIDALEDLAPKDTSGNDNRTSASTNKTRNTGATGRHANRPTSPRETCARKEDIGLYCVSSVLATQGINKQHYGPRSLFDGSDRTAWSEGVSGYGVGEWVVIAFDKPTSISGVFLKNGYPRKAGHFKKNSALGQVNIRLSNGTSYTRNVANHPRYQWLRFKSSEVTWVQVIVRKVRRGRKWTDTTVNELRPITP